MRHHWSIAPPILAILTLGLIVLASCSGERDNVSTEPSSQEAVTADTTGTDFSEYEAISTRYTDWIGRMDPFVQEEADGTYVLDWDGFLSSIAESNSDIVRYFNHGGPETLETKTISDFRDGIEAANAVIIGSKGKMQGSGCWNYWWGRRCCYWGSTGWAVVSMIGAGMAIPPWGWLLSPWGGLISYYMSVYGGFCVNSSWACPYALWITRS